MSLYVEPIFSRETIQELSAQGLTDREIAEQYGVEDHRIFHFRKTNGIAVDYEARQRRRQQAKAAAKTATEVRYPLSDVPPGDLLALIGQGWSYRQIAAHYGCSTGAITHFRKRHKIAAKPDLVPAEVAALAAAGYFDTEIAARLGCSPETIGKLRKTHGIMHDRAARQSRVEAEKLAAKPKAPPPEVAREVKIAELYAGRKHEDVSAAVLAREFAVRPVRPVRNIAELHDPQYRGEFP